MIRSTIALLTLLILLLTAITASAQGNPFTSGKGKGDQTQSQNEGMFKPPAFLSAFILKVAKVQKGIRSQMTAFAKDIRENPTGRSFWMFMLLAFSYGAVHALGPGHGKLFACSYFMNRPGTFRRVMLLSSMSMTFHVLASTLLVLTGYFILRASGGATVDAMQGKLEVVSYSMLILIGLFLMYSTVREARQGHHCHSHDIPVDGDGRSLWLTAIAAGMVPCPGAAMILIFAVTMSLVVPGIIAMAFVAMGMSVTLFACAGLTMLSRKALLAMASNHTKAFNIIHTTISFGGSLAIVMVGLLMLMARI